MLGTVSAAVRWKRDIPTAKLALKREGSIVKKSCGFKMWLGLKVLITLVARTPTKGRKRKQTTVVVPAVTTILASQEEK